MLHFVYGRTGAGKTAWMTHHMEQSATAHHVFMLVPDREAVTAESRASDLHNAGEIDVLTFRRLCNYIFRRKGGLCTNYIEKGAKKLMMRNVLRALSPALHEYGGAAGQSRALVEKLCATRTELYQNQISPADLDRAVTSLDEAAPVRGKASDLSVLFAAFDAEVASRFEDPDGMLGKAAALLSDGDFFAGTVVYVDSFLSFSAQQYDILREILRAAKDVYLSLPFLPDEDGEDASALCLVDTDRRLRRLASCAGVPIGDAVFLREAKRYQSDELAFLSTQIAGDATVRATWREAPHDIRVIRAANSFAESEAVALDICRKIRGGARYRDIRVLLRDTARYEGIVDAVFRKYEIPYFLSARREIREKPLIRYLFAVFAVAERGFRTEDVIALMKTGFSDLTPAECNLLENYMIKWNLGGRKLTGDDPWRMSPSGYGAPSERELVTLERLADCRVRTIEPLKAFSAAYRSAKTVREKATVLFDFLSERGVPEKLTASAEQARARGDRSGAEETVQVWNVFCDALDQLVSASGDTEADATEFSQMLSMVLSDTDIGKIPTSIDEVTISDASETVSDAPAIVYLLGVNEGVFPKRTEDAGLFSEAEKQLLAEAGIEITNRRARCVSEELYYFCRAASLPSRTLVVTYSHYALSGEEARPSVGVKRILRLFPMLVPEEHELSAPSSLLESRNASFELVGAFSGSLGRALRDYYAADADFAEKMRYARLPMDASAAALSAEDAEALFGTKLKTSYSRLETYIKCHFLYFCQYELKLQDRSPAKFGAVDIGTFLHAVLEESVRWISEGGGSDEHLRAKIREIASAYIASVFRTDSGAIPARLRHTLRYLCCAAETFAKKIRAEFLVSKFRPCDFELTVGVDGDIRPMRLSDGETEVELRGKIDRVDTYEDGDGKLYIRVVDYKTGEKTLERKNIDIGLDLQMLLYLFSLWQNGAARYGREILPAGVLYAGIKPPQVDLRFGEENESVDIRTSGLFLRDESVLRAMDPALAGDFIPVKERDLAAEKPNLLGLDAFGTLCEEVTKTVLHHAGELRRGNASAVPSDAGGQSPCRTCKMHAVCRIAKRRA